MFPSIPTYWRKGDTATVEAAASAYQEGRVTRDQAMAFVAGEDGGRVADAFAVADALVIGSHPTVARAARRFGKKAPRTGDAASATDRVRRGDRYRKAMARSLAVVDRLKELPLRPAEPTFDIIVRETTEEIEEIEGDRNIDRMETFGADARIVSGERPGTGQPREKIQAIRDMPASRYVVRPTPKEEYLVELKHDSIEWKLRQARLREERRREKVEHPLVPLRNHIPFDVPPPAMVRHDSFANTNTGPLGRPLSTAIFPVEQGYLLALDRHNQRREAENQLALCLARPR